MSPELLTRLRGDIHLIRDCSLSSCARDAAQRMLVLVDSALAVTAEPVVRMSCRHDMADIPSAALLGELAKRMRAVRVRQWCSVCKTNPVRARGLCQRCYKKAYRRGEIKNAKG